LSQIVDQIVTILLFFII